MSTPFFSFFRFFLLFYSDLFDITICGIFQGYHAQYTEIQEFPCVSFEKFQINGKQIIHEKRDLIFIKRFLFYILHIIRRIDSKRIYSEKTAAFAQDFSSLRQNAPTQFPLCERNENYNEKQDRTSTLKKTLASIHHPSLMHIVCSCNPHIPLFKYPAISKNRANTLKSRFSRR